MRISPAELRQAQALVAQRLGLHFPDGRMVDMERGLAHALRNSAYPSPEPYLAWLAAVPDDDPELRRLAAHLTIGETHFFRDVAAFDVLEGHVLPSLLATRRAEGIPRLRLWSAACATGEEPYSLAILLDRILGGGPDWSVTILATDINTEALEAAQRGIYRDWSFRGTPGWVRERYFRRLRDQAFELDPRIRGMVTFAPLNLAADGYPSVVTNTGAMDLVFCRNVLMYFTVDAQRATIARLQRSLVTGGWLLVGPAEASVDLLRPLVPVNYPNVTFYRKDPGPAVVSALELHPEIYFASPPAPFASSATLPADGSGSEAPWNDLARARALADQGSLDEALRLCEAALARNRLDPESHLLLAAIRQERGEIPAALEALRGALYLAPDSAPAHFLLGSLLLREGRRRRGRRCIETVVALLDPRPRDELVPGGDGLTAGRLLETARAYLEATA